MCLTILVPGLVGVSVNVQATGIIENPAFWAWMISMLASMGIASQNMGELIDKIGGNEILDKWLTDYADAIASAEVPVWDPVRMEYRYDYEAEDVEDFRKEIMDINNQYIEDYNLPTGTLYLSGRPVEAYQTTIIQILPSLQGWGLTPLSMPYYAQGMYKTSTLNSYNYILDLIGKGVKSWYDESGNKYESFKEGNYAKTYKNGVQVNSVYGSEYIIGHGFVPVLYWINANGLPDLNGNIWKLYYADICINKTLYVDDPIAVSSKTMYNSGFLYKTDELAYKALPFSFDNPILEKSYVPSATGKTSIYTKADQMDDIIATIEDYILNQATVSPYDVVIPHTDTLINDVASTNTVINNYYTEAVTVPNTGVADVDLDIPDISAFQVPTIITTKFPFSIPWDLKRAVQMFQATASVPVFTIPFVIESINFSYDIVIDLNQFEYLAKIVRWFVLAIFMVGLIMATRSLIKG